MPIPNGILCKIGADFTLGSQPFLFFDSIKKSTQSLCKKTSKELSCLCLGRRWKSIDRHIIVRFLINTAIQCNKFNIQSFFSYNIKAKQYELYLSLGNISVYNRNCNNVFCY